MEYNYIFDVDGTLTPSRQKINSEFELFFKDFINKNNVWLITGSDYPKTVEQVGKEICEKVKAVYNCAGNNIWKNGKEIWFNVCGYNGSFRNTRACGIKRK